MLEPTYLAGMLATVTFSVTGVLATRSHHMDVFGILVVGVVTAVGGGTLRDIILDVPVFWVADANYLVAAVAAALATFILRDLIQRRMQWLLYLDAFGVALFAALAVGKTLALGLGASHAIVMGVITGIGGGIIRDLLTGRPTLIMSRDLYASPILLGVCLQLLLLHFALLDAQWAALVGGLFIFCTRAAAVRFHWQMPDLLTIPSRDS
ncbi:MAG: TRIC cation channel family protein [Halieaceae bacterium]